MKVAKISIFLLPNTSESEAAGKLTIMPGMVDAAAMTPVKSAGVPRLNANGFSTGSFDIVELKMAKAPITHSTIKYRSVIFRLFLSCMLINC